MITPKETIALINTFKNPIIEGLKDIKEEVEFYLDQGIYKYVDSIREKFSKTKTFLYRDENIDFYDVYFPITLNNKKNDDYKVDKIKKIFSKSNFISIVGNAGSGKSMLIKHIFLQTIQQSFRIPVVIELRNLDDHEGGFFDFLESSLMRKKLTPNQKILDRILKNGKFLFLLDGYDEINSTNKTKLTSELIEFMDLYNNNYFVITSRPGVNSEALPRFDNLSVNPLKQKQIDKFIDQQIEYNDNKELAKEIKALIKKPENSDYNSFLTSPLLLSMFIMAYKVHSEVPRSKNKFYWNVFDTLYSKHDSFTKRAGYKHERITGLQKEDFENVLKWFSYISLFEERYSFDEQYLTEKLKLIKDKLRLDCSILDLKNDLTVAIPIILIDGLDFRFPHKSLQEYFAALLINDQDEATKKKIYSEKFNNSMKYSQGSLFNLYALCLELDKKSFYKYFILDKIAKLIDQIKWDSDKEIIHSFLGLMDTKLFLRSKEHLSKTIHYISITPNGYHLLSDLNTWYSINEVWPSMQNILINNIQRIIFNSIMSFGIDKVFNVFKIYGEVIYGSVSIQLSKLPKEFKIRIGDDIYESPKIRDNVISMFEHLKELKNELEVEMMEIKKSEENMLGI